jgi:regulator of protease activity HflC (stomatin/prohibitin superfamily)
VSNLCLHLQVINAKTMLYNTQNLPRMMSKVLQAQLRNVAGSLDVDQMIESTAGLNRVGAEMKRIATRWGVHVDFVKIQKVEAGSLSRDLEKKKNADLKNKEVLIKAKAEKQTAVINAEGRRDEMIKNSEGEAQAVRSRARGEAKAILNQARAEADSIKEIARAIRRSGENPVKYLLALKYIDALRMIVSRGQTTVKVLPRETAFLQSAQALGLNTIAPTGPRI